MKRRLKRVIAGTVLRKLPDWLEAGMPRVLVYHRFAAPGARVPHRLDADQFAWQLDVLCRNFRLLSLSQCVDIYRLTSRWPSDAVIITIDDGYHDLYRWAFPELRRRGVPATVFLTTRFVDGDAWLWPDRIRYALEETANDVLSISLPSGSAQFRLRTDSDRLAAWKMLSDEGIRVSDHNRQQLVAAIELAAGVTLPASPPAEFQAVSWNEVREMHREGIEIGAHTVNHRILSKIPRHDLELEIAGSKRIIEEHIGGEVRSFCYPNSAPGDIDTEVVTAVRAAGFAAAVFGTDLRAWDPHLMPRMAVSEDRVDFLWKCYGWERLFSFLRR